MAEHILFSIVSIAGTILVCINLIKKNHCPKCGKRIRD